MGGNSTYIISQQFSPPPLFANSAFSTEFYNTVAAFNGVILRIRINREDLLHGHFRYCSPLQTQVINSSYHATKSEDGCTHFTRLAVAALLLPLPKLTTILNNNSINSATFILSAMPGSFDSSFDVSHAARRIIFFQNKSLILFYCLLLDDDKKLFCCL